MNNFRKVNDDILRKWILFREDELSSITCDEDKKHWVYFNEIVDGSQLVMGCFAE